METIKIAIPRFEHGVAPCFEAANLFEIFLVEDGIISSIRTIRCLGVSGIERIRCLQRESVTVLICGGISNMYREMMAAKDVVVISRISGILSTVVNAFLSGELAETEDDLIFQSHENGIDFKDLVECSVELFRHNGFKLITDADSSNFPIDLIAEIDCPICGKTIRTAVCCGKHFYRVDEEIKAFHFAAGSNFNSRVFIHPQSEKVIKICKEFGIQFLDPFAEKDFESEHKSRPVPIIEPPIIGHEKIV